MEATATARRPAYAADSVFFDEAFDRDGVPRPHYARLIAELERTDLHELELAVAADLHSRGVMFQSAKGGSRFRMDPVPRLLRGDEWDELEAGLAQRVRALNAFLADAYGRGRIVKAGVVPAHVIENADGFEPAMRDVHVPHDAYAGAAGLDVVRDSGGRLMVLEDNLRTPSGIAYMEAARDVLEERLHESAHEPKRSIAPIYDLLADPLPPPPPPGCHQPPLSPP